jgi:ubiquinone/menaquinone biosynthesis C-methylase UbiE
MSSWEFLSGFYHACRRLPGMRLILDAEIRNCRDLWSRMPATPARILDVGTGAGSSLTVFPDGTPVIAVDASRKMLRRAFLRRPGLEPVQARACALPLRDHSFSAVSAVGLTEYLPQPELFLSEIARVSSPGAYLLITFARKNTLNRLRILVGNRLYLRNAEHWRSAVEAAGWEIKGQADSLLQNQQLLRKTSVERDVRSC